MYLTQFVRKPIKGKLQWVCLSSQPNFGLPFGYILSLNWLRVIYAVTENKVNLGSCKRPHKYIKFGE